MLTNRLRGSCFAKIVVRAPARPSDTAVRTIRPFGTSLIFTGTCAAA